ncbi:MAG: hypothetical protein U9N86_02095 [Bacteroidota bacterium]|nr:hypothetical protein [Bacteroidota bacterium]
MENIELDKIVGYKACTKDVQSTLSLIIEFNTDLCEKLNKLDARIKKLELRLNLEQRSNMARKCGNY